MHALYKKIENCIDRIDLICNWVYAQQYIHAINNIELFRNQLQEVSETVLTDVLFAVDENYYVQILNNVIEAQQQEDYVLFADLLQLQLRPLLMQCQGIVTEQLNFENKKDYFEQNCSLLRDREEDSWCQRLLSSLKDWKIIRNSSNYCEVDLIVEPTSVGAPTLLARTKSCSRYFHSNENPYMAARRFATHLKEANSYVVFGFGLGYHIEQLALHQPDAMIYVFEPDIGVLVTVFQCRDMTWLLQQSNIYIIFDKEYTDFIDMLDKGEAEVVFHYPSISMIPDERIRGRFEGIMVRLENISLYEKQFKKNIQKNIANIKQSAEVLKPYFKDKQVIIVAGGPSLDKNVHYLKECNRDNTVIFATGAVLKKLLNLNIVPDYAIITDPKQYTIGQIAGLEECGVPLLLMATAIGEISEQYKGDTYLICQEGVLEAEEYAKKKSYQTFRTGGSVATAAMDVAIRLGAGSIVFIGLDLAFSDNRTHASGLVNETVDNSVEYIQIKDWNGENISTSRPFFMYLQWMERRIQEEDVTMKIYDATEGGAKKKGMIPVRLIDILNKRF